MATKARLKAEGLDYQAQVTFYTRNGTRSRIDFVTRNQAQQLGLEETKTGNAPMTYGEMELFDAVARGEDVYPAGQNAFDFGLEPGVGVKITSTNIDIWDLPIEP
jgi:hypothetical protein